MDWYTTILNYYNAGYYTDEQVKVFVVKGKITATDYQTIKGQEYVA